MREALSRVWVRRPAWELWFPCALEATKASGATAEGCIACHGPQKASAAFLNQLLMHIGQHKTLSGSSSPQPCLNIALPYRRRLAELCNCTASWCSLQRLKNRRV